MRDPKDVRVHGDAFDDSECLVEHDVRGFAATPGKLVSSSIVRGTTPPNRSSSAVASPMRCWVFER